MIPKRLPRSVWLNVVLAVLGSALVVALAVLLERATQDEIVTRYGQRELLLAEQTAAAIQTIFDEAQRNLLHHAGPHLLVGLADVLRTGDEDEISTRRDLLEVDLLSFLRSHPIYTQVRLIDSAGLELAGVDRDGEEARIIPWEQLRDQVGRDFFVAAMQLGEGEVHVSEFEAALGHGEVGVGMLTLRMAMPAYDSQGRAAGIIVLNLPAQVIRDHLARTAAGDQMDAWVLDAEGVEVLNATHPELEGSNAYEFCLQIGDEALIRLTEQMLAGERGQGTYLWPESAGGPLVVKKMMAFAPVYPAEGQVWSVGISVTYDSVLAAYRQSLWTRYLLGGATILTILLGAVLSARSHRRRAIAEERARLSDVLHRRVEELSFLNQTAQELASSADQREILASLLNRAATVLGAEAGSICLREDDGALHFILAVGAGSDDRQGKRLPGGIGIENWVIREGKPALVPDVSEDPRWHTPADQDGGLVVRSILSLPLQIRGETIGALDLINRDEPFHEDDLRLMESVTAQAAVAIEKAQLYEEAQRRLESLANLNRASQLVTSSLEVNEVLEQIVRLASSVVDSDHASVALLDERGELSLGIEDLRDVPPVTRRIRPGGVARLVLTAGQPVAVDNILDDGATIPVLRRPDGEVVRANPDIVAAGIRSFAAVPIQAKGRMLGVAFVHSRARGAFREQLPLLTTFANQAAVAIENAQLYQQAQQQIKERERAESAVRESEERYRRLVDSSDDLIFSVDRAGVFKTAGGARLREFGLSQADVEGRSMDDLFPPEDAQRYRELHGQVFESGETLTYEHTFEFGGVTRSDLTTIYPIKGESGLVELVGVVCRDVTERKQAEEKSREFLEQVQQIMSAVPEGVLLLDREHRIQQANPAAQEYLEVLVGPDAGDVLARLGARPLIELLASPPPGLWHEVEAERRLFEIIAQPIPAGRESTGWVLVIREVTLEREIQTRALQRDRLAAVGQLAGGIAHDFNNIMAVIVLYAEMAKKAPSLDADTRKRLVTIGRQARRASSLIGQILDFSRRSVLERRPMDLEQFLPEMVGLLQRTLPETIKVELALGPAGLFIDADPTSVQQVMMNLAINARDAMPEGGSLHVGLERVELESRALAPLPEMEPGAWIRLIVRDEGAGIAADLLPHIFDPFFTTKEPGSGTGLGLAQVYGIVKQHEGHINVESEPGRGTTFTIYVPALQAATTAPDPVGLDPVPLGKGETLLVVEDNPDTRMALREALEELNYRALEAGDGREGLAVYEQRRDEIALVVSDVIMPEMGGVALVHALLAQNPEIKVVLVSGHALQSEVKELQSLGSIAWVPKPPTLDRLAQVIARLLSEKETE